VSRTAPSTANRRRPPIWRGIRYFAGIGIGQVPVILGHEALERGSLVSVLREWSLPTADISLIYPKARVLAPRVRALVDYLRATIRLK
jgi:DNA-binding transcriptional LysR family regulator